MAVCDLIRDIRTPWVIEVHHVHGRCRPAVRPAKEAGTCSWPERLSFSSVFRNDISDGAREQDQQRCAVWEGADADIHCLERYRQHTPAGCRRMSSVGRRSLAPGLDPRGSLL